MTQSGATVKGTVAQLRTAVAANRAVETFVGGTDFTAGTTTSLTLAGTYGSINNIDVYCDGVPQLDCTLSGQTLTFNPTIPQGTSKVIVKGGNTGSIGAPSDATVTDAKLAPGSNVYRLVKGGLDARFFGAIGDGVTDNTAALQALINAASAARASVWFEPGVVYAVKGALTIPNVMGASNYTPALVIYGNGATIKKTGGSNAGYLLASSNWVNNVPYSQAPVNIYDLTLDANGYCDNTLVNQAYFSLYRNCRFLNALKDNVLLTSMTQAGADGAGAVNNVWENCWAIGAGQYNFHVQDPTRTKITDYQITGGYWANAAKEQIYCDNCAGAQFSNGHSYTTIAASGSSEFYLGTTFGTVISNWVAEGDSAGGTLPAMRVGGASNGSLSITGCAFYGPLQFSFERNGVAAKVVGCTFEGANGYISLVNSSGLTNTTVTSIGNSFYAANPYVWDGAGDPIVVSAHGDYSISASAWYDGLQFAYGSPSLRYTPRKAIEYQGDVNLAMTNQNALIQLYANPLTANRTVTLPPKANLANGMRVVIARRATATGAFTLTVQDGASAINTVAVGTKCEYLLDGLNWISLGSSSL
ncbi:hypothetical protein BG58_31410 [Caballeronia jiangsuensis]|nr:hypothetical protein BG58_31410 [Caballeronia jiangsuensis]